MKMPKLPKKTRPGMVVGGAWYREICSRVIRHRIVAGHGRHDLGTPTRIAAG